MSTSRSDFARAARRHFADAKLLLDAKRLANADHLAGVAAECALKAILIGYLGGSFDPKGLPTHPAAPPRSLGHLPKLWSELSTIVRGRQSATLSALLSGPNKFAKWDVTERYSHGTHITLPRAVAHLAGAEEILKIYQQAEIDGVLQ